MQEWSISVYLNDCQTYSLHVSNINFINRSISYVGPYKGVEQLEYNARLFYRIDKNENFKETNAYIYYDFSHWGLIIECPFAKQFFIYQ